MTERQVLGYVYVLQHTHTSIESETDDKTNRRTINKPREGVGVKRIFATWRVSQLHAQWTVGGLFLWLYQAAIVNSFTWVYYVRCMSYVRKCNYLCMTHVCVRTRHWSMSPLKCSCWTNVGTKWCHNLAAKWRPRDLLPACPRADAWGPRVTMATALAAVSVWRWRFAKLIN